MSNDTAEALQKVIDSHGYGFHYAVIKVAEKLFPINSPWKFDAAEVPVSIRGQDTRVDIVLKHKETLVYLICECKRANPSLRDWCFLRAPYVKRDHWNNELIFEGVKYAPEIACEKKLLTDRTNFGSSESIYNIAVEIKGKERGDTGGTGRGEIETAATQVCRGLNGFVEFLSQHSEIITQDHSGRKIAFLVPVIFTTARILTTETDLSEADIVTGKLPTDAIDVSEKPWIWYRYHQSSGIKHNLNVSPGLLTNERMDGHVDVGLIVERNFARTVAVVSAAGIENFLAANWLP